MFKKYTYTDKITGFYRRIKPLRQLHNILLEIASKARASAPLNMLVKDGRLWK